LCYIPAPDNEKPDAELIIKAVQCCFATPVPCVSNLDELNAHFRRRCDAKQQRTVQSNFDPFQIEARFAEEKAVATALPLHRFDASVIYPARLVDKYQTVAFDTNRYSVPRPFAFQTVTVKGYVDQVVMVSGGEVIAVHARSPERGTMVPDPIDYLVTLDHKPAALGHSPVYWHWTLPACFAGVRTDLEEYHGPAARVRRYVRVLQLLGEHLLERVRQAIEECRTAQVISAAAIIERTHSLVMFSPGVHAPLPSAIESIIVFQVNMPLPDLSLFDQLIGSSSYCDGACREAIDACTEDAAANRRNTPFFA
jgi:hypothetical protein